MTDRITNAQLDNLVQRINEATGQPVKPYTRANDKLTANIGNYHLDWAYGGVKLVQMVNEGGGIRVISQDGFGTKRDVFNFMHAFLRGYDAAKVA